MLWTMFAQNVVRKLCGASSLKIPLRLASTTVYGDPLFVSPNLQLRYQFTELDESHTM